MNGGRIRRIRFKDGRPDVEVLRNSYPDPDGENWRGDIIRQARTLADYSEPGSELCGFVMIGMYSDGTSSVGWRRDPERIRVPRYLMPAYVSEIVRDSLLTQQTACDVINRAIDNE